MTLETRSRLDRTIAVQRWAMAWERLWTALHWPLVAIGLVTIFVSSGLAQALPQPVRLALFACLTVAFVWSLRPLLKWVTPTDHAAMRRIEAEAAIAHRTLSSKDDAVVAELVNPETRALWAEHKRRQLAKLDAIRLSPPRSSWRNFDPRALRVPVALATVASLLLGSGSLTATISDTVARGAAPAAAALAIDAWLKPPAYTGKPPVLLTSAAMKDKLAKGGDILVPENAVLTVRATGAMNARIEFRGSADQTELLTGISAKTATTPTGFTAEAKLTRPALVRILDGTTEIAAWPIAVIPDTAPEISFPKPVGVETGGALTVHWSATDDYGVRAITSEIELADEQQDGIGFVGDGPFLYEPPVFAINLKKANAKSETGKATHDLTAHPWAGLNVNLRLTAKDAAGNATESTPLLVTLPERIFTRPLAKALIEQRKHLILSSDVAPEAAGLLGAILLYPDGLIERSGHHIRLSAIVSRLENSATIDDIKATVADLWQLALDIEDGTLADAKAELAALKKQLEQALKNGASPEEIARLMDKMRAAMNRYMDAMRKEMEKRNQQAGKPQQQQNGDQQTVTREDLERMMDMIEKLSKNGQKDQAQALLEQLDRMLQNMQPGQGQQAGEQSNQLGEMLDQLSEMMRQQQRLMDETQRMPNGRQPGDDGQQGEQGQQGQQGEGGQGGLADRQGALGDMLDKMMRELGGNAPGELGDAGREMRGAQGSLGDSDKEGALQQQGNAMDKMRKGAGELRRQMQKGQGQARNRGRDGEAGGTDEDPLGRPRATRNPEQGIDRDMVPTEEAARRAREIIKQLRDRASENGLTDTERGYIDRLLRGLY
jgi:uncharacterized protein (TIGR02302 family)